MQEQSQANAEKAKAAIKLYNDLSSGRGNWETQWQEVAERVLPSLSGSFFQGGSFRAAGDKRTELLFDSTASIGLSRYVSIVDWLLTPGDQTWHGLKASDPYLNKNRQVKLYFEEVTRILFKHRYAPRANFVAQNHSVYQSQGAFGTGILFIDELKEKGGGLRYKSAHIGQTYIAVNHQGIVDQVVRYFPLQARQAVQKWGDLVGPKIKEVAEKNPEREFFFLHKVSPNNELVPGNYDYRGMPFSACYVAMEGQQLITEEGFNSFPYSVARATLAADEIYGRSPAMEVLPAIKTLNEEKKTILKQGHRALDPVLLGYDDGVISKFANRPGALNLGGVSADGRPLIHALPVGNIAIGKELMDDERAVIKDAFFETIFQILTENPQMTATEVLERTREKGILLAPTLGRTRGEYLGNNIERELDVLAQQPRMLPPMPGILIEAKGEYTVEYDSPLSRMQKAEQAAGAMRTVEMAINIATQTQNPEVLDHFNFDVMIPDVAEINSTPFSWMNGDDKIAQLREARQKQQEFAAMTTAAPGAAAMINAGAKVAEKAPPGTEAA